MFLSLLYLTACSPINIQVTNIIESPRPSPIEYWTLVEETARLERECEELVLIKREGIYSREFSVLRSSYTLDLLEIYGQWGTIPEEVSDCLDVLHSP
ncbi:hypothetical protein HN681_04060 [archaeon]|jgi:hypothetical protein|nr:hypothetical protein [archaeon]MBT3731444.1 hypothetical protein [archaeon]MBT4670253.1 hypothetical protein [archaeon]MBT5029729.1 hypothetical protein [archaeon]MBT5287522.1 hypothetical protein [archaeon]